MCRANSNSTSARALLRQTPLEQTKKPAITLDWRTVTEILSVLMPASTDTANHGQYAVDDPASVLGETLHCILQRAAAVALVRHFLSQQAHEKQWCLDCRIDVTIAKVYGPYCEEYGGPVDRESLADDYVPPVLDYTWPDESLIHEFAVSFLAFREPESFGPGWQPFFGNFGEPEILVEGGFSGLQLGQRIFPETPGIGRP